MRAEAAHTVADIVELQDQAAEEVAAREAALGTELQWWKENHPAVAELSDLTRRQRDELETTQAQLDEALRRLERWSYRSQSQGRSHAALGGLLAERG